MVGNSVGLGILFTLLLVLALSLLYFAALRNDGGDNDVSLQSSLRRSFLARQVRQGRCSGYG
jgi:hypothetical protein